jgi:ribosomal protein S18 acetylase RimI-like enzyme
MEIILRKAVEADLAPLTRLGEVTFREAYAEQNTAADIDFYVDTYLNECFTLLDLQDADTVFYLAFCNGELAGYVKLKKMPVDLLERPGEILELKRIYVLKEYYGSGAAQKLMQQSENLAKEKGLQKINLAVWKDNPRAIAFYLKMGFTIEGETTFDWGTGKIDSDWVMTKILNG